MMARLWVSVLISLTVLSGIFGCNSVPQWVSGLDGLSVSFPYRDLMTRNAVVGTLQYTGYSYLNNVEMDVEDTITDAEIIAKNAQAAFSRPNSAYAQARQAYEANVQARQEKARRKAQGLPEEPEPIMGKCLLLHFTYFWELDGRYPTVAFPIVASLPVEFNVRGATGWTLREIHEAQRKVHGAGDIAVPKMEINTDYEFVAMLTPSAVAEITYQWHKLAETGKRLRLGISNNEGRELRGGSMRDAPLP